jgi:hypothetical protein
MVKLCEVHSAGEGIVVDADLDAGFEGVSQAGTGARLHEPSEVSVSVFADALK